MIKQRVGVWQDFEWYKRSDIQDYFDTLIVPHTMAPVMLLENGDILMQPMNFSLIPRWSKERKPKFATHNARLETIAEKPAWKESFQKRHCLVPMTDFIEPIYEGEHAGHMVGFRQRPDEFLCAAGIWEEWTNRDTGEIIESFSIITADPPPFIAEIGHDRCPVFLNLDSGKEWLKLSAAPAEMIGFLNDNRMETEFTVERVRAMRPGWEKRK